MKWRNDVRFGNVRVVLESDDSCLGLKHGTIVSISNIKSNVLYMQMLQNNHISGILDLTGFVENNAEYFRFKLHGRVSLKTYLRWISRFSDEQYLEKIYAILSSICKHIASSKNYFLSKDNFILNTDCIFLDSEYKNVSLIYSPFDTGNDFNGSFLAFVSELFENRSDKNMVISALDEIIQLSGKNNGCICNSLLELFEKSSRQKVHVVLDSKNSKEQQCHESLPLAMYNVGKSVWGKLFCSEENG